jgi:hypothetical protein
LASSAKTAAAVATAARNVRRLIDSAEPDVGIP